MARLRLSLLSGVFYTQDGSLYEPAVPSAIRLSVHLAVRLWLCLRAVRALVCFYAQKLIVVKFFSVLYKIFGLQNLGLLLEFRLLVGIGRSGRLVAFILLQYHLSTPSWCRVMTEKTNKLTTKKATTLNM